MNLREQAERLIEKEDYPEAAKLLSKHLDDNLEDPKSLFLLGYCFMKTEGKGLAMQCFIRANQIFPGEPAVVHNIGKLYHDLNNDEKADEYFRRAVKMSPSFYNALEGLGMTHLNRGEFEKAIHYCNRALAEEPESVEARINRGMSYLALRRWREGWTDYNANVGHDRNRVLIKYGDEPRWDGSKGKNVVVFGEQGIGDEISFASCLPDLIRDCNVTIECDGRVEKLFRRSFGVETFGTRYKKESDWRQERKFDAHIGLGELPEFYRNKDADFPGTPYLKPNPEIALQWRALLQSLGPRPKVGISWSGGLLHTGQRKRSVTLDTLSPLFRELDVDWVSLQYKEPDVSAAETKYGVKIHDWEWGTRVYDYDHTVALISELDVVISVCTTVIHAAGGLGKETYCLVPVGPLWRYMDSGETYPWAKSVKLMRQKGKEWPVINLLGELRDRGWAKHRASQAAA